MKFVKKLISVLVCTAVCTTTVLADTTENLVTAWRIAATNAQGGSYTAATEVSVNSVEQWKSVIKNAAYNLDDEITVEIKGFNYDTYDLTNLYDYNYSVSGLGNAEDGYAKITYRFRFNSNFKIIQALYDETRKGKLSTEERYVYDEMKKKAAELTKNAKSDYEKELAIHDYIVGTYSYYEYTDKSQVPQRAHEMVGIVLDGEGVCEAYAELFRFMATSVGLEVYNAEGSMNGVGHMWNVVKIDGEWYHLDCTGDDPSPDVDGRTRYAYFNLTDEEISADHVWDNKADFSCTATKYNYYVYNNYLVHNGEELAEFVSKQFDEGKKTITFKTVGYKINSSTIMRNVLSAKGCASFGLVGDYGREGVYTIVLNY
jgi:transglutaminase-like putative cysteine protease